METLSLIAIILSLEISHKKNKLEFLILFTPALKGDFQNMILLFIKLLIYSIFYFFAVS